MLTYARHTERTKKWDVVYDCWRVSHFVRLTIKRDEVVIGSAETEITHSLFYRKRLGWQNGRKFRKDWRVCLNGREWTIPGLRTRSEVLEEIKRKA
jgi:hypothetical protein